MLRVLRSGASPEVALKFQTGLASPPSCTPRRRGGLRREREGGSGKLGGEPDGAEVWTGEVEALSAGRSGCRRAGVARAPRPRPRLPPRAAPDSARDRRLQLPARDAAGEAQAVSVREQLRAAR